jgi:hypothetical protein
MALVSAALLALAASNAHAAHTVQRLAHVPSVAAATDIPPAAHFAPITGRIGASARRRAYKKAVVQHATDRVYTGELAGAGFDEEYTTAITVGGQNFTVIFDTGASTAARNLDVVSHSSTCR